MCGIRGYRELCTFYFLLSIAVNLKLPLKIKVYLEIRKKKVYLAG